MGLQAMGGPNALDKRGMCSQVLGQDMGRPLGGTGWGRLRRRLQNASGERLARFGRCPHRDDPSWAETIPVSQNTSSYL